MNQLCALQLGAEPPEQVVQKQEPDRDAKWALFIAPALFIAHATVKMALRDPDSAVFGDMH